MTVMDYQRREVFSRRELRKAGCERVIAGVSYAGEPSIEIQFLESGAARGRTQIRIEGAPIVAAAVGQARASAVRRRIGAFRDGRYQVDVLVGKMSTGETAVILQRIDDYGNATGSPVALYGEELDAIESGVAWMFAA